MKKNLAEVPRRGLENPGACILVMGGRKSLLLGASGDSRPCWVITPGPASPPHFIPRKLPIPTHRVVRTTDTSP